jgi:UDP-GlcNAc:undecaprenyl-phosphate/decaprenyl-phosphate GlcNAc-1-phosphate transferase
LCYFLLNFGGSEEADKHGISTLPAARIGGVLLVAYLLMNVSFQAWVLGLSTVNTVTGSILLASLPFFLLGLYEDWHGILGSRFRFGVMLVMAGLVMWWFPMFVIQPTGVWLLDIALFDYPAVAWFVSMLSLAFIPNAFNTADGANGLVSGISLMVAVALARVAPAELVPLLHSVAIASVLFLLYNLVSGRFFLGDGGAYFLGALTGLCVIVVANADVVSVWYLLALVFYPVADLLFSMARRVYAGRSPFAADNEHLHNLIFAFLIIGATQTKRMNTLTGVSVAFVFSGTVFAAFYLEVFEKQSPMWGVCLAFMCLVYMVTWRVLYQKVCVVGQSSTV